MGFILLSLDSESNIIFYQKRLVKRTYVHIILIDLHEQEHEKYPEGKKFRYQKNQNYEITIQLIKVKQNGIFQ